MHAFKGYRFEGLAFLVLWAAFIAGVVIFDQEARRLHAWAFFVLMAVVAGLCIAGEYFFYRLHSK